jgi:GTPase SAR1 and related small G proteins
MLVVFFVGIAGSGKSTLVSALYNWMDEQGYDVAVVNLDPAAEYLPYVPDVDIRERINARKIMRQFKLGPNASI